MTPHNEPEFNVVKPKDNKIYCNICQFETEHDEDGCVYHQRVKYDEDGVPYLKYEEFNQDGEEW